LVDISEGFAVSSRSGRERERRGVVYPGYCERVEMRAKRRCKESEKGTRAWASLPSLIISQTVRHFDPLLPFSARCPAAAGFLGHVSATGNSPHHKREKKID